MDPMYNESAPLEVTAAVGAAKKQETAQALADTVRHTGAQAAASMRGWCESVTWRESAMSDNAWASLPQPVWDRLLREDFSPHDLQRVGQVCRQWHEAVSRKTSIARETSAGDSGGTAKEGSTAERQGRRFEVGTNSQVFAIPIIMTLVLGLAGLCFFVPFFASVSEVPACAGAEAMVGALYSCSALWLADAVALLAAFVVSLLPASWQPRDMHSPVFKIWNACRLLLELGVVCSDAVCIHNSNFCMALNPLVSWQARAYAATSLVFGLIAAAVTVSFGVF
jgi:hypothetical protein